MYNKFAMNLSKFKKIDSDKEYTTMKHEDGHIMKIAHEALTPQMRAQIKKMPSHDNADQEETEVLMAKGGMVAKDNPQPKPSDQPQGNWIVNGSDPEKRKKLAEGMKAAGFAKGGMVSKDNKKKMLPKDNKLDFEAIPKEPLDFEAVTPQQPVQYERMAEGGEAAPQMPAPQAPEMPTASTPAPTGMAPQQPQDAAPQMEQEPPAQESAQQPVAAPDMMHGYQGQIQGAQGQAAAEGAQGQEQAHTLTAAATQANNMMQDYQSHYQQLDDERKAFQDDIINSHIDPNKYLGSLSTGQKFDTAVGLILGGLGGGGQGNAALDFLNKQIDRDIDAQKAQLGKKDTLLSANLRQFGNLKDATDMTRVMQHDIVAQKLKIAEAKAVNPIAKARAQAQIGALEQQAAPLAQQLATRRMLDQMNNSGAQGAGQPGKSAMDPTSLIPSVVPEHHQEAVYKEVERAQNVRKVATSALDNFDAVTKQMKSLGGLGRAGVAAYSPAQLQALEAELGTTVGDQEGTVRETAMHNVKNAYLPRATDSPDRLEQRRKELENYLSLKSAAPRAKSFGIDLDKFGSTTRDFSAAMDPQQQKFAAWAKANPQDPRAALVLKKLGIK